MKMKEKKLNSKQIILVILLVVNVVLVGVLLRNISEIRRWRAQFEELTASLEVAPTAIPIIMPETVYVANGTTMEIYNAQVTGLAEEITKYNVCWKCDVGENLERKFSVVAKDENIGTHDLVLEIYDNNLELIAWKACTLEIVPEAEQQKQVANVVTSISEVPAECLEQVEICVDTEYYGTLDALKPEGVKQMQDIVYSVLCGI